MHESPRLRLRSLPNSTPAFVVAFAACRYLWTFHLENGSLSEWLVNLYVCTYLPGFEMQKAAPEWFLRIVFSFYESGGPNHFCIMHLTVCTYLSYTFPINC